VIGIIGPYFEGSSRLYPLCFFKKNSNGQEDGIVVEMLDTEPYLIIDKSMDIKDFRAEISFVSKPTAFKCDNIVEMSIYVMNFAMFYGLL
jgi:hypothetical protein